MSEIEFRKYLQTSHFNPAACGILFNRTSGVLPIACRMLGRTFGPFALEKKERQRMIWKANYQNNQKH